MRFISIALFGLLGVFCRYFMGMGISKILPPPFPYGTFIINLVGAFAIGIIYVLGVERFAIPSDIRVAIIVGFLGGFTTFSSYCLESFLLFEKAEYLYSSIYFVLSPISGFLATLAGVYLTRRFLSY